MNYSNYQEAIFEEAKNGLGNVMVKAVAGSGKTFTLIETMKRINGSALFCAFNKSIAEELGKKVPANVDVSTLHSIGLKTIVKNFGYIKVDNRKLDFIMDKYMPTQFLDSMDPKEKAHCWSMRESIKKIISLVKANRVDYKNHAEIIKNSDYYGIDFQPDYIAHVSAIMDKSIAWTKYVDFDDMIFFPVFFNMKTITYDFLFVDECQDLNKSQIELVMKLVKKPNGRVFAVGDPKQSIYGFRGADTEAMDRIQKALNAKELPLSICYRCPKSHVAMAQEIVDYIESAPNAIEGTVENIKTDQFVDKLNQDENHLVICRTNAPLISYAISLIKQNKKAHVRGSDIGKDIKNIIRNMNASSCIELIDKASQWESKQLEILTKRWASESVKDNVIDKADMIRAFAEKCDSIEDIINTIDDIFSDDTNGTIFSSVHRAKGLEADVVYILNPEKLPLIRKNQQDWELEQEMNIKYVALTRAKQKMVMVSSK